jgi:hypothetical protein
MNAGLDYRLIAVLMQQLPQSGKWTADKRQRWLTALERNLDLMIEVVENEPVDGPVSPV